MKLLYRSLAIFVLCVILVKLIHYNFQRLCLYTMTDQSDAPSGKKASINNWPKVILFGDSITQFGFSNDGCWVSLIADKLQRKCDVVNRGFSGYNSRWCRIMLPQLVTKNDVNNLAAFVIFLGANDANMPGCAQHVPVEEYGKNLEAMIQYLMDIGVERNKIILANTPPCDNDEWAKTAKEKGMESFADNKYKQQYAVAARSIAAHMGCGFVDTYMSFMKQANWKEMLVDGLHFSEKGARYFESLIWPAIDTLTENLPFIMPYWKDVATEHYESVLTQ